MVFFDQTLPLLPISLGIAVGIFCLNQVAVSKGFCCDAPLVREVAEQVCRFGKSHSL